MEFVQLSIKKNIRRFSMLLKKYLSGFSAFIMSSFLLLSAPLVCAQNLENGQQLFQTLCARCHGMLGEGSEGPSLTRPNLVHAPDDAALVSLIVGGIPGTGMPGSRQLRGQDGPDVAAYVRSLGELPPEEMPGDAMAGAQVYKSIGNCSGCHILNGEGFGIGPELSNVGQRRTAAYLRRSVTSPEADQPRLVDRFRGSLQAFLTVRIVSEIGTYEGMRINEDAFTVQMRDMAGEIYSFKKSDLISYEKVEGHSLMPGYNSVLNEKQIDDVVSYLMSLK
jgi:putative heme-binding domain-containing protein